MAADTTTAETELSIQSNVFFRQRPTAAGITAGLLLMLAAPAVALAADSQPVAAPARGLPDDQLAPLSLQMQAAGNKALAAGQTATAIRDYEAALAADPRNRDAYVGLARGAEANGLPGHAVRYYRQALELDPNDLSVLELQGLAYLKRGAAPRAEENLDRLQKLCPDACPQAERLAAAIKASPRPAAGKPAGKSATAQADGKPATPAVRTPAPPEVAPATPPGAAKPGD